MQPGRIRVDDSRLNFNVVHVVSFGDAASWKAVRARHDTEVIPAPAARCSLRSLRNVSCIIFVFERFGSGLGGGGRSWSADHNLLRISDAARQEDDVSDTFSNTYFCKISW